VVFIESASSSEDNVRAASIRPPREEGWGYLPATVGSGSGRNGDHPTKKRGKTLFSWKKSEA
jgi:hypothetical protein